MITKRVLLTGMAAGLLSPLLSQFKDPSPDFVEAVNLLAPHGQLCKDINKVLKTGIEKHLFEHNDKVTRTSIKNYIENKYTKMKKEKYPEFNWKVQCDLKNNPDEIIANNDVRVDVKFKPSFEAPWYKITATTATTDFVIKQNEVAKNKLLTTF